MSSDPPSFDLDNPPIEMPCVILAMENIDGRLMVVLEDGRTVDMTDMFGGEARQ